MEKEVIEKIKRFVTLSEQFTKSENEVFPVAKDSVGWPTHIITGWTITNCNSATLDGREVFIDKDGIVKAKDNKLLTRADKLLAEAQIKAKLSDEYDEYLKLQIDLKQYFKIIDTLIK